MPWKKTRDSYRIFVSEVMLQQTQVSRVLVKYPEFLKSFPNWKALAKAPIPKLLLVWQGMGYNRRALHLKKAACIVVEKYRGKLPKNVELIDELPGVGKATAASIAASAFNLPTVFIETNIRRAFIHHFFPTSIYSNIPRNIGIKTVSDTEILPLVEKTLDRANPREWYWALMDYGAMLGRTIENPNRRSRHYVKQSAFKGSSREARGKILKTLLGKQSMTLKELRILGDLKFHIINKILDDLILEGFISKISDRYELLQK